MQFWRASRARSVMPMPDRSLRPTVRLTAEQRALIESQFARFERERPGQRATLAGVLRTLALEWAVKGQKVES